MSAKINVCIIIKDHFNTLRDYTDNKLSKVDVFIMIILPLIFSIILTLIDYKMSEEFISLTVNFSSIVTSLLISVLVLIYDQYYKIEKKDNLNNLKKEVLSALFKNVSYTILMGVFTVIFCLLQNIFISNKIINLTINIEEYQIYFCIDIIKYLFSPIILFCLLEMILTLFMSLKRLHIVFFAE